MKSLQTSALLSSVKIAGLAALLATATSPAALLMYYDFDSETGGSVADLSGNGQTGTLNGTSTLTADGGGYTGLAGDRALSFFPNNYFTATSTVSPGGGDWSVSFWYRTAATGTIALVDHSQSPDSTSGYQMFGTAGGGQVSLYDDDGSSHLVNAAGVASGDLGGNTWHHIALSVDRLGADTMTVYIDGGATDSVSLATLHDFTFGEIQIGTFNAGQVGSTGQIDDYAIFDIALTSSQVTGLASGSLTPQAIPEPSALALLGLGGLLVARRRRA